jgi:hypothetical protein
VFFRRNRYRFSKTEFRFFERLNFFLRGDYVWLRRALCKSKCNGAHAEERDERWFAQEHSGISFLV